MLKRLCSLFLLCLTVTILGCGDSGDRASTSAPDPGEDAAAGTAVPATGAPEKK